MSWKESKAPTAATAAIAARKAERRTKARGQLRLSRRTRHRAVTGTRVSTMGISSCGDSSSLDSLLSVCSTLRSMSASRYTP